MTAVIFTILPVFAVVFAGWAVARANLISAEGINGFNNVTFYLFVPALLFRAMRGVHLDALDLQPLYAYFGGALIVFAIVIVFSVRWLRRNLRHATVTALAVTFSNTVLLGIPLIKLAFGDAGLVILLMIVSMHSLVLFAVATLLLEFTIIVDAGADGRQSHARNLIGSLRNTLINPVILPIVAGLSWGALRWPLPDAVDAPLAMLAAASGPCSLVLLGASIAQYGIAERWRPAAVLTALKNIAFPLFIWAFARHAFGIDGIPLAVITVTAALPIGANVFLFAQRYQVAQAEITAAVTISTAVSMLTLTLAMLSFS